MEDDEAAGLQAVLPVNGLRVIILCSIAFVTAEWGSIDVRFGVTILGVAFIAFLTGSRWGQA